MIKVSVVIPVYNVESYLGECLDSILGQTLREIEVICIDDGSTDSSPEILKEYASRDPRMQVFTTPNAGAYRAREVGIGASSGEYLYLMDSDDILESDALRRLSELADRERLDQVVFSASVFVAPGDERLFRRQAKGFRRYYSVPEQLCGRVMAGRELMAALLKAGRFHVSPPLRLLRSDAIRSHKWDFPQARSRADNYFTPVSLYLAKRAYLIADKYYRRRLRPDSISTAANASAGHFRNTLEVVLKLLRFMEAEGEPIDEGPMAEHVRQRIRSLRQYMDCPAAERREAALRMSDSLSVEARGFLMLGIFPLLNQVRAMPRTISGALNFIIRRLRDRVFRRRSKK